MPTTIADELQRISDAKAAIKASVNAKGGSIVNELIDAYAAFIDALPSGGGYPATGVTTSVVTGDDGDLQKGVAKALTDNLDGTVTDANGLMWIKEPHKCRPGTSLKALSAKGRWDGGYSSGDPTAYVAGDLVANPIYPGSYARLRQWQTGLSWTVNQGMVLTSSTDTRYKCTSAHTADAYQPGGGFGNSKWDVLNPSAWSLSQSYTSGDYVTDTGLYKCISSHTSTTDDEPGVGVNWATYWELITAAAWVEGTNYTTSSYVTDGWYYKCSAAHQASDYKPETSTDWATKWEVVTVTIPLWETSHAYSLNDMVYAYTGSIYCMFRCTSAHTSGSSTMPMPDTQDHGLAWTTKWDWVPETFVCISNHSSALASEPLVGASWATYWVASPFAGDASDLTVARQLDQFQAIQAANNLTWLGHSDWRLPNLEELLALVNYGINPVVNDTLFPSPSGQYLWSSTPQKNIVGIGPGYCYRVKADYGEVSVTTQNNYAAAHYAFVVRDA